MVKNYGQSPSQFGKQQIKRRLIRNMAIVAAFIVLIIIDHLGWIPVDTRSQQMTPGSDMTKYHNQEFLVVKVVDGDTIDIDMVDGDKTTTRVRFWGIDTPEVAKKEQDKKAQPWADEAWAFTREHCVGQRVTLELQKHSTRGKFGRLLAYVKLNDGRDLNAMLLKEGLARYEDRFSHDRLDHYRGLERQARKAEKGMWGNRN